MFGEALFHQFKITPRRRSKATCGMAQDYAPGRDDACRSAGDEHFDLLDEVLPINGPLMCPEEPQIRHARAATTEHTSYPLWTLDQGR